MTGTDSLSNFFSVQSDDKSSRYVFLLGTTLSRRISSFGQFRCGTSMTNRSYQNFAMVLR